MANINGWGRGTWGQLTWGEPLPLTLTAPGAGTSALGTVSVDAEANVTPASQVGTTGAPTAGVNGKAIAVVPTLLGSVGAVSVNVDGIIRSQIHPVLDNRNNTIEKPNAFQIITSLQIALAKAIALHGLGLYIFAGEDLPEPDALTATEKSELLIMADELGKDFVLDLDNKIQNLEINAHNYEMCIKRIQNMIQEKEKK